MGVTKDKLRRGEPALGGWIMIGHPAVGELMAGEGFDWICVDLEHTGIGYETFQNIACAIKGSGADIYARLHGCDPTQAKHVLDAGANGIIVPMVNSREEAEQAVAMAKFPPIGERGASFCRAADFGRNFRDYYASHNDEVMVAVMIEHIRGVEEADAILSTPGVDAAFIGPCDLSASMGKPGQVDDPEVRGALQKVREACKRHKVAAGIHVIAADPDEVSQCIEQGFQFIACGIDTEFVMQGCRAVLRRGRDIG